MGVNQLRKHEKPNFQRPQRAHLEQESIPDLARSGSTLGPNADRRNTRALRARRSEQVGQRRAFRVSSINWGRQCRIDDRYDQIFAVKSRTNLRKA